MRCATCGKRGVPGDRFCSGCGAAVTGVPDAATEPRYPDPAGRLRRDIAALLGGLAVLLGAAYAVWYFLLVANSPTSVVRRFVDADVAGRLDAEQQLVLSRWDNGVALTAFQTIRRQAGSSPFNSYILHGATVSDSTAYVPVDVPIRLPGARPGAAPAASATMTVTFVLLNQDGHWRIDATQTLANAASAFAALGYSNVGTTLPLPGIAIPGGGNPFPVLPVTPPSPPTQSPGTSL